MIVYGMKTKKLKYPININYKCTCGNREQSAFGLAAYAHLFFIPVMIFNKEVILQCSHCQKVVKVNHLSIDDRPEIPKGLFSIKNTWNLNFVVLTISILLLVDLIRYLM